MAVIYHELTLRSPVGELLDVITDDRIAALTYSLKENAPGVMELTLPGDYDITKLFIDGQFEIRRAYGDAAIRLEGDTGWFIRRVNRKVSESGIQTVSVTAYSALELMARRIIPYVAGSSYTDKVSIPWDDLIREIVDENFGPGASYAGASYGDDPARNLEPWLVVEPDYHHGVNYPISRTMPWQVVLAVLQDIINDMQTRGIHSAIDIVWVSPGRYEFRVFIGTRGSDHSADSGLPVIVSEDRYNLAGPAEERDWVEEHNYIYAAGQGEGTARVVKMARDDGRINVSPFNRQEFLRDCRQSVIETSVQAEANSALEEQRPKRTFSGSISQTEGCLYGVHWDWGDIVTAEYEGSTYDCYVDAVTVTIGAGGTEIVSGQLRSVASV